MSKKIISILSPASVGKTFIAVNLAVVAARSSNVSLVDLDFKERAVHTWLNLPSGSQELEPILRGHAVKPQIVSKVNVYCTDIKSEIRFDEIDASFLESIKSELIIIDMPREMTAFHKKVLLNSNLNIWIGDPDYQHLLKLKEVIEREPFLVINKYKKLSAPLDFKDLFGIEPVVKIPLLDDVYDSILTGEPLVTKDTEVSKLFNRLLEMIKIKVLD